MQFIQDHAVQILSVLMVIEQILPKTGLIKANSTSELIVNFVLGLIKKLVPEKK